MNDYYVLKLLDNKSVYRPDTLVINEVELRSPRDDYANELAVIKRSVEENKAKLDIEFISRIGTIVQASSINDAEILADHKFVKVLDILSNQISLSNIALSNCGYVKNLSSGKIEPLISQPNSQGTCFIIAKGKFQQLEFSQWITTQNTELSERYLRSLHWLRNAKWEKNAQIRILFRWFAIEALFKKEEHDRIDPLIRWFLGYPNGSFAQYISQEMRAQLQANPIYDKWKNRVTTIIDEIRVFRNDSIHNGFTAIDIPQSKLIGYDKIMFFASSRCINAVERGLISGYTSVDEFKTNIVYIFESKDGLVGDIHNTILYSIDNDHFDYMYRNTYC